MMKPTLGSLTFAALALLISACGTKPNDSTCKTGAEACHCYANDTCDDGLSCLATVCLNLSGVGGAASILGGAGSSAGGSATGGGSGANDAGGSSATGGGAGGSISNGGSVSSAGSISSGGSISNGGSISTGGSSGTGGGLFPPNPAGCARVTTCPSCCQTTGVFALDSLAFDATSRSVTAFNVSASAVTADFNFTTSDEVGAIFFHFSTAASRSRTRNEIWSSRISGI